MQNKTSHIFWPRAESPGDKNHASAGPRRNEDASIRLRILAAGLLYVGLFSTAMFLEVYVKTQLKSRSLEIWTLARRKVEIESEMTRLDLRLMVLESPMRLESLASSEIGLTAEQPQQKSPDQTP